MTWAAVGNNDVTSDPREPGARLSSRRARRIITALLAVLALVASVSEFSPVRGSPAQPEHDEWDVLNLMNRTRRSAGLAPLAMVDGARRVARSWSAAMAAEGELSHNPNLLSQLEQHFREFHRAGENVGRGNNPGEIHTAFMNSPGHRANILGEFRYAGVGVVHSGGRMWVTVDFIEQPNPAAFIVRVPLTRVAGASDSDTSILVSRRLSADSAAAVVVARVDDFADALSGSALAARHGGPLLLSPSNAAPANLVDEASRVLAPDGTVFLLGGPAALAPQIEVQFAVAGMRVVRLAGADRFGTAAAVAPQVNPDPTELLLVSGVNYADAVVAGSPAGATGAPVILVGPTSLPPSTELYLASRPATRRVLVGGPAAVSDAVAAEAGVAERVFGADRFATAVAVANKWFPAANRLALASGTRFQDALIAAAEAGRDGFPVVLGAWPAPDSTYAYVAGQTARWGAALVVGRASDVNDDAVVLLFS